MSKTIAEMDAPILEWALGNNYGFVAIRTLVEPHINTDSSRDILCKSDSAANAWDCVRRFENPTVYKWTDAGWVSVDDPGGD